jgi:hypothetical protein
VCVCVCVCELVSMLQVPVNERCVVVNFYLWNEVKIICLLSGVRTCYSKFRGLILMHFDMLMQPELTERRQIYTRTFCGLQYKRVQHHGSLHREGISHFQISTEAYLGGI